MPPPTDLGVIAIGLTLSRRLNASLFAKPFTPTQFDDEVALLDRSTLAEIPSSPTEIPAAHGVTAMADGNYYSVTNIAGNGTDALWTVDGTTFEIVGSPDNTGFGTPHNVALSGDETTLYITH